MNAFSLLASFDNKTTQKKKRKEEKSVERRQKTKTISNRELFHDEINVDETDKINDVFHPADTKEGILRVTKEMQNQLRNYVSSLQSLVDQEFTQEQEKSFERINTTSLKNLEKEGEAILHLKASTIPKIHGRPAIKLKSTSNKNKPLQYWRHHLSVGDDVLLSRGKPLIEKLNHNNNNIYNNNNNNNDNIIHQSFRCTIHAILSSHTSQPSSPVFHLIVMNPPIIPPQLTSGTWSIFRSSSAIVGDRVRQALLSLLDPTPPFLADIITGATHQSEPIADAANRLSDVVTHKNSENIHRILDQINPSQRQAVQHALSHRMSLIQGPPGTGKTRTAAAVLAAARQLHPNIPILASSASNTAVDNMLAALKHFDVPAVRLGHVSKVRTEFRGDTVEGRAFRNRVGIREEVRRSIKRGEIVCGTCVGAGVLSTRHSNMEHSSNSSNNDSIQFSMVLIDESTQCTEAECLIPLLLLQARHAVLVGDPQQLPPTITSTSEPDTRKALSRSLMERLNIDYNVPVSFLDRQYRMHPAIAAFPSSAFYSGRLLSADSVHHNRIPPPSFPWIGGPDTPLLFINTQSLSTERVVGKSRLNVSEASLVCDVVDQLRQDISASAVGVITPYAAQAQTIRTILQNRSDGSKEIEVNTVDGFQGREKDVIVVSAVRSNPKRQVGFVSDRRRLNVALTRSKRGLIIMGDISTLSGSSTEWENLIKYCREREVLLEKESTRDTWWETLRSQSTVQYNRRDDKLVDQDRTVKEDKNKKKRTRNIQNLEKLLPQEKRKRI